MEFNIQKLETCTGHKGSVFALSEGLETDTFFSSGEDGTVVLWNLNYPDLGSPIVQMAHSVYAMLTLIEKKVLVIAQNTSGLHFFDLETRAEITAIPLPSVSFFDLKIHDSLLFAADSHGFLHIIDVDSFTIKHSLRLSEKSARSIAINSAKKQIAIGFSDFKVRVLDLISFKLIRTIEAHSNSVFGVCYSESGLLTVSRDAKIKRWDVDHNFLNLDEIPAHLYAINAIIKLESLPFLITCSMDKSIKIWRETDLKLLKVINKAKNAGHATSINRLLWLPKKEILLSASDDRTISIWKLF